MGTMLKIVIAVAVAGIVTQYLIRQQYNYGPHDRIGSSSAAVEADTRTIVDHGPGQAHQDPLSSGSGRELWRYIGTHSGVETYVKQVKGSKLLAFRGIVLLDMNISQAMGPYMDLGLSPQWVSMLRHIVRLPLAPAADVELSSSNGGKTGGIRLFGALNKNAGREGSTLITEETDIVYQKFQLPWPITPRDILLQRRFEFNDTQRSVRVHYHRAPQKTDCIRAESPFTTWTFRAMSPCSVVEGSVPLDTAGSGGREKASALDRLGRLLSCVKGKVQKKDSLLGCMGKGGKAAVVSHPRADGSRGIVDSQTQSNSGDGSSLVVHAGRVTDVTGEPAGGGLAAMRCSKDGVRRTLITIESFVDSKGSIPAWFINYMQSLWPSQALNAFRKLAEKGAVEPYRKVIDW